MGPWSLKGMKDLNERLTATDLVCSVMRSVLSQTRSLTRINGLRTFFASFEGDGGGGRDDAPPTAFFGGVAGCVVGCVGDGGGEENTVERSFSCSGANLGLGLRFFQVLRMRARSVACGRLLLSRGPCARPLGWLKWRTPWA